MKEDQIDPNLIIQTKSLFDSAGWTDFESRVMLQVQSEQYKIDEMLTGNKPLLPEDLIKLNFLVANKNALLRILLVKREMLDDVDPFWEEKVEAKEFAVPVRE